MFTKNEKYKRSEIHDKYSGNRRSGIAHPADKPYIFIFSGKGGIQHGYKDQWLNDNVYSYTGSGQIGDMAFKRGNLQLRDHLVKGKRIFLFEYVKKGWVQYIDELVINEFGFESLPDKNNNLRNAIIFFFNRKGSLVDVSTKRQPESIAAEDKEPYELIIPESTEKRTNVNTRVGQGAFRKSIIHKWEYKCAVTQFDNTKILIASHIVPWKESTDQERLDTDNGILLSPTYDALFDKHLISFDEKGKIMLGKEIQNHPIRKIGVSGNEIINRFTPENQHYLETHRLALR